jgi:hypothetical protein
VCLDGEKISVRITLFGLVVENSVRLVIFWECEKSANFYYFELVKYCLDSNLEQWRK